MALDEGSETFTMILIGAAAVVVVVAIAIVVLRRGSLRIGTRYGNVAINPNSTLNLEDVKVGKDLNIEAKVDNASLKKATVDGTASIKVEAPRP